MAKVQGISGIAKKMLSDINRRFDPVKNRQAPNFDPLYVASTLLNPPYRLLLNTNQVIAAKSFILSLIANGKSGSQDSSTCEPTTSVSQETEEPPVKWFKHLSRVDELLSKSRV
uniref:Uncharacterized protein n=1 Tax=Amphimedon queenslandica TaxID=400682 RepID=A0A1X7V393_AMPQE